MSNTSLGNNEIFSRNLRRQLKNANVLQKDVAKAVGVSTGTFADWCNGKLYPRMDKLQLLADYFGINKSELVEDVYIAKETISKEDQEILDAFHKVPKEKRKILLAMIQAATDNL
jgi:transcriptional regulator with XRE-family HTH domain